MANTVLGTHGSGTHAARPAGNAVPDGSLYSCTTHSLVYVSNYAGNSWATWANLSGTGMADPMTTRGDIIVRDSGNATARLALGAAGKVLRSDGSDLLYSFPSGYEFDYAQFTSEAGPTATTEATANTVVTGGAVTYDGSTIVQVEFYSPYNSAALSAGATMSICLYDGSSSIGILGLVSSASGTQNNYTALRLARRITPSNAAHTYSIRAFVSTGTGKVGAGAGGVGNYMPGFMRITKVA